MELSLGLAQVFVDLAQAVLQPKFVNNAFKLLEHRFVPEGRELVLLHLQLLLGSLQLVFKVLVIVYLLRKHLLPRGSKRGVVIGSIGKVAGSLECVIAREYSCTALIHFILV